MDGVSWVRFVFFAALGGVIGAFAYDALKKYVLAQPVSQAQLDEGV